MPKVVFTYGTGERGSAPDENGATRLKQPKGIFVDANGSLLLADSGNNRCLRFPKASTAGTEIAGSAKQVSKYDEFNIKLVGDDELDKPFAVWQSGDTGQILIADTHNNRILAFKESSVKNLVPGQHTRNNINTPEGLKYPRTFLVADDKILLADSWSHRVLEYSYNDPAQPSKVVCGVPNSFGTRTDQLAYPTGLALLPNKGEEAPPTLFVADTANNRVQRFAAGEAIGTTVLGKITCETGSALNELDSPSGLCLHPATGDLVVVDRGNHRVLLIHEPATALPAHAKVEVLVGPEELKFPWAACFDSEGYLYVSDEGHHRVLKIDLKA